MNAKKKKEKKEKKRAHIQNKSLLFKRHIATSQDPPGRFSLTTGVQTVNSIESLARKQDAKVRALVCYGLKYV